MRKSRLSRLSLAAGSAIFLASGAVAGGSIWQHIRQQTTIDPLELRPTSLVKTGVNRVTRNPMYVGLAGMLAAHAAARRSLRCLIPVGLFVAAIDRWQIPAEEAVLRELFGAEFDDYVEQVSRWLGPVRG